MRGWGWPKDGSRPGGGCDWPGDSLDPDSGSHRHRAEFKSKERLLAALGSTQVPNGL